MRSNALRQRVAERGRRSATIAPRPRSTSLRAPNTRRDHGVVVVVELLAPDLRELGRQRLGLAVGGALPRQLERLGRLGLQALIEIEPVRDRLVVERDDEIAGRSPALSAGEPGSTCATNISACSRPVYVCRLSVVSICVSGTRSAKPGGEQLDLRHAGHLGAAEVDDARAAREPAELVLDVAPVAHRLAVDADDQIAGARGPARAAGDCASITPTSGTNGACVMPTRPCTATRPSRWRTVSSIGVT